jgi:orotidine-5'-phosphate decarboxylase
VDNPFTKKLGNAQQSADSWLCLGLDTDADMIPASLHGQAKGVAEFNRALIEATRDLVCAYKPNLAFYLARGSAGIDDLVETVAAIPHEIPIILDAKFGDIDSSARGYAHFAFETLGVDAVTVNPYLGSDSIAPFLEHAGRAIFLLAHTSNRSASELQDTLIANDSLEPMPEALYVRVARSAARLKGKGEVGLVVGATFPEQLQEVRTANPTAVFLIPGIGTQGGSLAEAVRFGRTAAGIGPIINASRSILYASGGDDFDSAARASATSLRDEIRAAALPPLGPVEHLDVN